MKQKLLTYEQICSFCLALHHLLHAGIPLGDCLVLLAEDEPEIMAAQFCLPISVWINLCDREPDREAEVMELVEKHIRQFFRLYQRSGF